MNSASTEALLVELSECQALLQGVAARLRAVASAMEGAGAGAEQSAFPNRERLGNAEPGDFPNHQQAGKVTAVEFPQPILAGEIRNSGIPQPFAVGESDASVLPSMVRLCIVLKLHAFPAGSHKTRIYRAARVMLSLKTDPGAYGNGHFAKLLGLSYSGAGKAMMGLRDLGLIKHAAYKVHVLTEKGERLLVEAVNYVPPIE